MTVRLYTTIEPISTEKNKLTDPCQKNALSRDENPLLLALAQYREEQNQTAFRHQRIHEQIQS